MFCRLDFSVNRRFRRCPAGQDRNKKVLAKRRIDHTARPPLGKRAEQRTAGRVRARLSRDGSLLFNCVTRASSNSLSMTELAFRCSSANGLLRVAPARSRATTTLTLNGKCGRIFLSTSQRSQDEAVGSRAASAKLLIVTGAQNNGGVDTRSIAILRLACVRATAVNSRTLPCCPLNL